MRVGKSQIGMRFMMGFFKRRKKEVGCPTGKQKSGFGSDVKRADTGRGCVRQRAVYQSGFSTARGRIAARRLDAAFDLYG